MTGTSTQDTAPAGTQPAGGEPGPVVDADGGRGSGDTAAIDHVVVEADSWAHAVSTYRYLRLSPVVVVLTLAVSLIMQIWPNRCALSSISAYYYTPVHAVFIAALGLTGLALIAIRGSGTVREAFLNGAGLLAPVVAFIPTARPAESAHCSIDGTIGVIPQSFTSNSLWAFMAGGALIVVVALGSAAISGRLPGLAPLARREIVVPPIAVGGLLLVLAAWHHWWPASFMVHAHSYSAIAMFGAIGVVVLLTARDEVSRSGSAQATAEAKGRPVADRSTWYGSLYVGCVGLMAVGVAVAFIGAAAHWYHTVLAVELIETLAFLVFWATQSHDLWNVGAAPEPARAGRTLPRPPVPANGSGPVAPAGAR